MGFTFSIPRAQNVDGRDLSEVEVKLIVAIALFPIDHALRYGYDHEYGGVYRDGVADQSVLVYDKEWWQNFESLVGFLNGYKRYGDSRYLEAFLQTWTFIRRCFLNMAVGESRQLLKQDGTPIISNMGNAWKGIYHTGRALAEGLRRLDDV